MSLSAFGRPLRLNLSRDRKWLEPISKSPEENDQASELDEAEEVLWVVLPSDKDAALPLDPGKERQVALQQNPKSLPVLRYLVSAVTGDFCCHTGDSGGEYH